MRGGELDAKVAIVLDLDSIMGARADSTAMIREEGLQGDGQHTSSGAGRLRDPGCNCLWGKYLCASAELKRPFTTTFLCSIL